MKQYGSSTTIKHYSLLALLTSLLAFVVILLGAYTRLTDAGLSCPDWPHCYGNFTAPHTFSQLALAAKQYPLIPVNIQKAWTEMTHRYFAGSETILILLLCCSILLNQKTLRINGKVVGAILASLLATQIILGMLTVTEKLKPIIVLSHLLTGLSILCVLWWILLSLQYDRIMPLRPVPKKMAYQLIAGFMIISLQIMLGGWVSTHQAALACIDLPYCNGKLLPALHWFALNSDLITIHMLHRIGAVLTGCYLVYLAIALRSHPAFRFIAHFLLLLLFCQLILGMLNILWLRPIWVALLHHSVAILLLLTMITGLAKAFMRGNNRYEKFF